MPGPLSNRDYVYYRKRRYLQGGGFGFVYKERDVVPHEKGLELAPKGNKCIRAGRGNYWRKAMCRSEAGEEPPAAATSGGGAAAGDSTINPRCSCLVLVRSQEDFAGKIPKTLVNWTIRNGCAGFVKSLQKAALQLMVEEGRVTREDAKLLWGLKAKKMSK